MQVSFVKRFFIGTCVMLAMARVGIPLSQAEPLGVVEECVLASAVPLSQIQPEALSVECSEASVVVDPSVPAQPGELTDFSLKKMLANSLMIPSVHSASAGNLRNENSPVPAMARKELAMRKRCREMDDREMDGMCGGITGSFDMTQAGNLTLNDNSNQSISFSDQAQQNLSSMVNITSINSTISVMLNLNVNINSTVGTVNQGNTGTQNTGVQNSTTLVSHP